MLLYLHMDSLVSTQDNSFYLIFPPKAYSSEHADILIFKGPVVPLVPVSSLGPFQTMTD